MKSSKKKRDIAQKKQTDQQPIASQHLIESAGGAYAPPAHVSIAREQTPKQTDETTSEQEHNRKQQERLIHDNPKNVSDTIKQNRKRLRKSSEKSSHVQN